MALMMRTAARCQERRGLPAAPVQCREEGDGGSPAPGISLHALREFFASGSFTNEFIST